MTSGSYFLALCLEVCAIIVLQAKALRLGSGFHTFGGDGGGMEFGGSFGGLSGMFVLPPSTPIRLHHVNASTMWGDVAHQLLQLVRDRCTSQALCDVTVLGPIPKTDSRCSGCHPCGCDELCHARGDCCLDKVLLGDLRTRLVLSTPPGSVPELAALSTCKSISLTPHHHPQHGLFVTACPATFAGNAEVATRCLASATSATPTSSPQPARSPGGFFNYDYPFQDDLEAMGDKAGITTPVATTTLDPEAVLNDTVTFWPHWSPGTGLVYGNADCATCHGQDLGQLRPWDLRLDCPTLPRLTSPAHLQTVVRQSLAKTSCQLSWVPPAAGGEARPCRERGQQLIDTCNVTGRVLQLDPGLWAACHAVKGHVSVGDVTYSNIFCAVCNDERVETKRPCPQPETLPVFLVLNASALRPAHDQLQAGGSTREGWRQSSFSTACRCPEGEIFDQDQMTCRQLRCSMTRVLGLTSGDDQGGGHVPLGTNRESLDPRAQYRCLSLVRNATGLQYEVAVRLLPTLDPRSLPLHRPPGLQDSSLLRQVARNIRTSFVLQGSTPSGWHVTFHRFRVILQGLSESEAGSGEGAELGGRNISVVPGANQTVSSSQQNGNFLQRGKSEGGRPDTTHSRAFRKQTDAEERLQIVSFTAHIRFVSEWPEPPETLENRLLAVTRSLWNISLPGEGKVSFRAQPVFLKAEEKMTTNLDFSVVGLYSPLGTAGPNIVEYALDIPDTTQGSQSAEGIYVSVAETLTCPKVALNVPSSRDKIGQRHVDESHEDSKWRLDENTGAAYSGLSGRSVDFQYVEVVEDEGLVMVCAGQLFPRQHGQATGLAPFSLPVYTAAFSRPHDAFLPLSSAVLVACQAVFLACLAGVVVSHCATPELLATAQGRLTVGLALSTLLALLLSGVGVGVGEEVREEACLAMGILAHYCLLAAFSWLPAATYNAARQAAHRRWSLADLRDGDYASCGQQQKQDLGLWRKLLVACLLLPALLVALTVFSNRLVPGPGAACRLQLGYGEGLCFLSNRWSLWLGAVAPVCLSVALCLALCAYAFFARHGISADQRRLRCARLVPYAVLTLLMGGGGLSGLGALLTTGPSLPLWAAFAALCCLTGLAFLGTFLLTNRRLWQLCGQRFAHGHPCCCCCYSGADAEERNFRAREFALISQET